jgi:hypothetical protein
MKLDLGMGCDDATLQHTKGFLGLEWRVSGTVISLNYVRDCARSTSGLPGRQNISLNAQTPNAQHRTPKAQAIQSLHGCQKSNALASLTNESGASLWCFQRPKRTMPWPSPCMSWSTRSMLRLDASILGREAILSVSAHVSDETSLCYLACFALASLFFLSSANYLDFGGVLLVGRGEKYNFLPPQALQSFSQPEMNSGSYRCAYQPLRTAPETSLCYLACFVLASLFPPSTSAAVRPTARDELRLVSLCVPAVAHRA